MSRQLPTFSVVESLYLFLVVKYIAYAHHICKIVGCGLSPIQQLGDPPNSSAVPFFWVFKTNYFPAPPFKWIKDAAGRAPFPNGTRQCAPASFGRSVVVLDASNSAGSALVSICRVSEETRFEKGYAERSGKILILDYVVGGGLQLDVILDTAGPTLMQKPRVCCSRISPHSNGTKSSLSQIVTRTLFTSIQKN